MTVTMESAVLMGKNYLNNCQSIANTKDLTLRHMFDISTRLVSEQDEISGLITMGLENNSWKYLSLIGDKKVINLQRTKVYVFSDSVLCLGKIHENPQSNDAWEDRLGWCKSSPEFRNFNRIDSEPMEFEWNIFPGFTTLELCTKVQELLSSRCSTTSHGGIKTIKKNASEEVKRLLLRLDETPENFTGRIIFMQCSMAFLVDQKTTKKNAWQMPNSYLCTQGDLEQNNGHFLVLVQRKSAILSVKIIHNENGTMWRKRCCWNSQQANVQFSVLQVHCRDVDSKAKDMENCRYTMQPIWKRLRLFFTQLSLQTSSVFTEQSRRYVNST